MVRGSEACFTPGTGCPGIAVPPWMAHPLSVFNWDLSRILQSLIFLQACSTAQDFLSNHQGSCLMHLIESFSISEILVKVRASSIIFFFSLSSRLYFQFSYYPDFVLQASFACLVSYVSVWPVSKHGKLLHSQNCELLSSPNKSIKLIGLLSLVSYKIRILVSRALLPYTL